MKSKQLLLAFTCLLGSVSVAVPSSQASTAGCPQWHDLAINVGYTEAVWARMSPICGRESGGQKTAINRRSGDYGLLQVHCSIWCKIAGVTASELLDPATNLRVGLQILCQQGWRAWSARGGRVCLTPLYPERAVTFKLVTGHDLALRAL